MSLLAKLLIGIAIFMVASVIIAFIVLLTCNNENNRLKSTDCKYCRKKLYHPFYYGKYRNELVSYYSTYFKLLKKTLSSNSRCIIKDKNKAFYETKITK